jgi:hypothetical protein
MWWFDVWKGCGGEVMTVGWDAHADSLDVTHAKVTALGRVWIETDRYVQTVDLEL